MAIVDMLPWTGKDRWTITPLWMSEDRAGVEASLLRILAFAQREKLDTKRMVDLFADEHWGINRWRLFGVAKRLAPQTPIVHSLMASGLASDDHTLVCLRIGETLSQPTQAWDEALDWHRPMNAESARLWRNQLLYWTVVGWILLNLISGIWYFIGPSIRRILSEFELMEYSDSIESLSGASLQIALVTLIGLQLFCFILFLRRTSSGTLKGQIERPRFWSFATRRRECLRQLSLCLHLGIQDQVMIETILKCNPNSSIRKRLSKSLNRIAAGAPIWQSLSESGLLTVRQAKSIARCASTDVQSWALKQFTLDERESSFFNRMASGLWIQPALTLAFGVAVLLTGYAMISALSEMIRVIAERHG